MDFNKFLAEKTEELDKQISLELREWQKEVLKINPNLKKLSAEFILCFKGGKKLRGILVELGYEIATNTFSESLKSKKILKVAIAYEIFHSAVLIHDDIIDRSPKRRGIETLYKRLGGNHYGISQSISLGDLGFFLAFKKISQSDFEPKLRVKAIEFFSKVTMDTSAGEVLDVEAPLFNEKYRLDDVLTIHTLKTARYSVSGPLILGAILAGGSEKFIKDLEEFGLNLGLAFQIQDDLLGVFGEEKEVGKSASSDIEEGKNTLLISRANSKANPSQQEIINKIYGKKGSNKKEIDQIKQVFIDTGSVEYSKSKAKEYVKIASSLIPKLTKDKNARLFLERISNYFINRNK